MSVQLSIPARNDMLAAIFARLGASPLLEIRSGVMPATAATAATGVLLASMTLPAEPMAAPANGVIESKGPWSDPEADAAGFAAYFRLRSAADGVCHMQGLVSQQWFASTAFAVNQQVHNGSSVYRCTSAGTTAASGGPSGTAAAITDGGVTWAYVGPVYMTIDNTNLAVKQPVGVKSLSLTAPGA